jgi:uncharacterized LabA/DUF88 family protein
VITNVYVDGFNLYYGCLKGTAFKWLNLEELLIKSYPDAVLNRLRYFTAQVKSEASDPSKALRQQIYLRALETLPVVTVHLGQFLVTKKRGVLIDPRIPGVRLAQVSLWEEKGSDVNIATHLVADAFRSDFERAIVVSNDSDLVEPISLVKSELGLEVNVLSPHGRSGKPSFHLQRVASSYRAVDRSLLASSQFPPSLLDAKGRTITKPTGR